MIYTILKQNNGNSIISEPNEDNSKTRFRTREATEANE